MKMFPGNLLEIIPADLLDALCRDGEIIEISSGYGMRVVNVHAAVW